MYVISRLYWARAKVKSIMQICMQDFCLNQCQFKRNFKAKSPKITAMQSIMGQQRKNMWISNYHKLSQTASVELAFKPLSEERKERARK